MEGNRMKPKLHENMPIKWVIARAEILGEDVRKAKESNNKGLEKEATTTWRNFRDNLATGHRFKAADAYIKGLKGE